MLFKVWWRDWRRFLSLGIGVMVAVAAFVDLDLNLSATGAKVVENVLSNLSADALVYYQAPSGEWFVEDLSQDLSTIPHVIDVEAIGYAHFSIGPYSRVLRDGDDTPSKSLTNGYSESVSAPIYGLPEDFRKFGARVVSGSWNLSRGNVLISSDLSEDAGLGVGDCVTFIVNVTTPSLRFCWESSPLRVAGVIEFSDNATSLLTAQLYKVAFLPRPPKRFYAFCLGHGTFEGLVRNSSGVIPAFFAHYVWVERRTVVDPWNLDATKENVKSFELRIRNVAQAYGANEVCLLSLLVSGLSSTMDFLRILLGALSFPLLLLCWYLVLTAGHLIARGRRREIGLLKVRGVPSRSILASYLAASLSVGLVGSFLGLLLGGFMTYWYQSPWGLPLSSFFRLWWRGSTVAMAIGLGCGVCLVASIIPARVASRLSPLEATMEYVEVEEELRGPGKWTLLAFALGAAKVAEWLLGFNPLEHLSSLRGAPFFVVIPYFIYASFDALVLNFLGPVLFIYGVSALLLGSRPSLREVASVLAKPAGRLKNLVVRDLSRNPSRASKIAFLAAICVAFSLTMALLSASFADLHYRTAVSIVGSDLKVVPYGGVTRDFADNLSSLPYVGAATPVVYGTDAELRVIGRVDFYVIDPFTFLQATRYEEGLCEPSLSSALEQLKDDSRAILISESLAEQEELRIGDYVWLRARSNLSGLYEEVRIVGIVKLVPGCALPPSAKVPFVVVGFGLAESIGLRGTPYFLVKVRGDPLEVARSLKEEFPDHVSVVVTVEDVLRESPTTPLLASVESFLAHALACSIAVAAAGLCLVSAVNVEERAYELALMRARGMARKQAISFLLWEFVVILVVSLALGVALGFASAWGLLSLMGENSVLPPRLVLPIEFWAVLGVSSAALLMSCAIPALLAFRAPVVERVRFR